MMKNNNQEKTVSFFAQERKEFKLITTIALALVAIVNLYLLIVIILPFWKVRFLIENVYILGYPIYAFLLLLFWFPALFLAFSLRNKKRFTDYQFILEARTIWKSAILLSVASLGTSLFLFKFKKVFRKSTAFVKFQKENNLGQENIWLSDMRPIKTVEALSLGLAYLVIIIWVALIIFPIYKLIKQTFNGNLDLRLGPTDNYAFSFKHFARLFANYDYGKWMLNSLFISTITMVIVVVISAFSGFVYSRYRFKTKKTSLLLVMTLGIIPAAAAISSYYLLSVILKQGLSINPKWLLIFIYSGGGSIGNIFILKGYLDNISTELDDAALIDGCNKRKLFFKIIFPLMKPMLAVTAIGAFTAPFGDFMLPGLLFYESSEYTLAQGLQVLASGNAADETAFAAGAIIIAVPITTVIMISQSVLTKGTTKGGVKG